MGAAVLCERVTTVYLWQFPKELARVDRATMRGAVRRALFSDSRGRLLA